MAFGFSFHGVVSFALTIFSFLKNKNRATSLRMEQSPNQETKNIEKTPQLCSYNNFDNARSYIPFS